MSKLLLISLMLLIVGTAAVAAPLCTVAVHNAADFEALGTGGCQFGDKVFYGFTYVYTRIAGVVLDVNGDPVLDGNGDPVFAPLVSPDVPAASVVVTFSNYLGQIFMPMVSFLANWDVQNGLGDYAQGDIRIDYSVSAPVAAAMHSSWVTLSGFGLNNPLSQGQPTLTVAESITPVLPFPLADSSLGVTLFPAPGVTFTFVSGTDQVSYAPSTQIAIGKNIFIDAGGNGNEAAVTEIDQRLVELTSIPEPMSAVLFGIGLTSLGILMKRKRPTT